MDACLLHICCGRRKTDTQEKECNTKRGCKKPKWMDYYCVRKVKKKYHAWKRYTYSRSYRDYQSYCKIRNSTTKAIRFSKRKYQKGVAESSKTSQKSFWSFVKGETNTRSGIGDLRDKNGNIATEIKDKANILNDFFASVFTREDNSEIPNFEDKLEKENFISDIIVSPHWGWMEDAQKQLPQCPVSCTATSDKSTLTDADAVMFHTNDFWKYKGFLATIKNVDIELPKLRTPNQVWALFSWEPMIYHWGNIPPNIMNWTMLYRRESSIYMPFTSYYKMTQKEITQESTKAKETTNYFQEKTKFATTMVSNCNDQARRYRIIDELQQYIDLDYFGKCSGKIICKAGVPTTECGEMNFKKYKFYLAFENSFCRDYVSEKFWNALDRRQIPVIAAPKYNLEMLPPNSYLNVFDFPSIKAVAERMIEIGSNEALFNSFFEWTKFYKKDNTSIYCKLSLATCNYIHRQAALHYWIMVHDNGSEGVFYYRQYHLPREDSKITADCNMISSEPSSKSSHCAVEEFFIVHVTGAVVTFLLKVIKTNYIIQHSKHTRTEYLESKSSTSLRVAMSEYSSESPAQITCKHTNT
ncbi:FUCTC-like protein [Mya arenaria]|uniref:Fucosyltransferase n=1 Tax=Mya arenaria TaxID=6604 RepID=A0ABY7DMT0_MYAAR|nr:FUCTC-like protein [Mya arenaria]